MLSVRIWRRKVPVVGHVAFPQMAMSKLGTVGVAVVKMRVQAALGPTDSPAKPLKKRYAIRKTKRGKGSRRDLTFSGDLLRNLMVRTVSDNKAQASFSTRRDRIKAWANQKIEPWLVFSPKNRVAVVEATRRVFAEIKNRLLSERGLSGKPR